jgi:hypothetical protein
VPKRSFDCGGKNRSSFRSKSGTKKKIRKVRQSSNSVPEALLDSEKVPEKLTGFPKMPPLNQLIVIVLAVVWRPAPAKLLPNEVTVFHAETIHLRNSVPVATSLQKDYQSNVLTAQKS